MDLGAQRLCQLEQGRRRRRDLPSLDPADVCLRDAASVSEVSLTKATGLPRTVDDLTEWYAASKMRKASRPSGPIWASRSRAYSANVLAMTPRLLYPFYGCQPIGNGT